MVDIHIVPHQQKFHFLVECCPTSTKVPLASWCPISKSSTSWCLSTVLDHRVLVIISCFSTRLAGWLPWQCHMTYMWSPMAPVCTPITFSMPSPTAPSLSLLTLVHRWVKGREREWGREVREEERKGGREGCASVELNDYIPAGASQAWQISVPHMQWWQSYQGQQKLWHYIGLIHRPLLFWASPVTWVWGYTET